MTKTVRESSSTPSARMAGRRERSVPGAQETYSLFDRGKPIACLGRYVTRRAGTVDGLRLAELTVKA